MIMSQLIEKNLRKTFAALIVFAIGFSTPLQAEYDFVNWESPHVHPIDITPDMLTLVAVNTADNRLEVFDLINGVPQAEPRASIAVGLDPVSVRARSNTEVWVVNHVSDSISIVDLSRGIVTNTLQTDDEPADVIFAQDNAYVSISQANSLMIFDPDNLIAEPQTIPLSGEDPRALAVSPDGSRVYVAFFESGNGSTIIRGGRPDNAFPQNAPGADSPLGPYAGINPPPNDGNQFNPPQNPANETPPPVGMIVKKDNAGRWMDDNNRDWSDLVSGDNASESGRVPGWDLQDNDIAVINTSNQTLVGYHSGLMNMVMGIDFNPNTNRVTAVGSEAHNEVRFEPNLRSHFVTMQYADATPLVEGSERLSDLNSHLDPDVDTLPLAQRSNSIGDPRSITWGPTGINAWITGMGSNNILLVNSSGQRLRTQEVGQGPTGIVFNDINPGNGFIFYVLNRFDASISVVQNRNTLSTVSFYDPTPDVIREGRPLLYGTHEGSGLGQTSCASCHVDGRADRLAWNLGNPAADMDQIGTQLFHPMKGPLRTTSLTGIVGSPSLHFRGDKADLTEFSGTFTALQGLADEDEPNATDMRRLEAFIGSIHTPPNPYRNTDNSMPNEIQIPGADDRVGNPNVANNCANCHGSENARDNVLRNNSGNMPGGQFSDSQPAIAPSLISMYEILGFDYSNPTASTAGFGFIPDGSMDIDSGNTLRNNNLTAFMLAFNGDREFDTHAAVGKQVTEINATTNTAEEVVLLADLLDLAQDEQIGLIAKGVFQGNNDVGFVFDPEINQYQSNLNTQTWTHAQLLSASGSNANNLLTFTAVPFEGRTRMGIARFGPDTNTVPTVTPIDNPDNITSNVVTNENINIDGNNVDWSNLSLFADDPDDVTNDSNNHIDWLRSGIAHSDDTVYLLYQNHGNVNPNDTSGSVLSWGWQTYIDTDNNPNTGYQFNDSIGAEILIEGNIIKQFGGGEGWDWNDIGSVTLSYNNTIAELSFPRSLLGVHNAVQLAFYGNNESVGGSTTDAYPNSGGFEYFFGTESSTEPDEPNEPINIDGNSSEWNNSNLFTSDPDDVANDSNNPIDWLRAGVTHSDDNVYLLYENHGNINPDDTSGSFLSWGWQTYIDTDNNPNTGYQFNGSVGAEILIEGNRVHLFGGGGGWDWIDIGSVTLSYNNTVAELSFPRSLLGVHNTVQLAFFGNNESTGGSTSDAYPSTGSFEYSFGTNSFESNATLVTSDRTLLSQSPASREPDFTKITTSTESTSTESGGGTTSWLFLLYLTLLSIVRRNYRKDF